MAPNLTAGTFKIVSLTEGNPSVGVNLTLPAFQKVYLNAPVTTWKIEKVGSDTYELGVGGYPSCGVTDDNVMASIYPKQNLKWIATYRDVQDAYTITPAGNQIKGWTVPQSDETANPAVVIKLLISTTSFPPLFLHSQLFRFEEVKESDE